MSGMRALLSPAVLQQAWLEWISWAATWWASSLLLVVDPPMHCLAMSCLPGTFRDVFLGRLPIFWTTAYDEALLCRLPSPMPSLALAPRPLHLHPGLLRLETFGLPARGGRSGLLDGHRGLGGLCRARRPHRREASGMPCARRRLRPVWPEHSMFRGPGARHSLPRPQGFKLQAT